MLFKYILCVLVLLLGSSPLLFAQTQSYTLRFRNRTPQTLTTAVCAVHSRRVSIFEVGEAASSGLASLAEDGVVSTFVSELRAKSGVRRVVTGSFVGSGGRESITFQARAHQRISCVFGMLVVTNDGFPAVRSVRMPRRVGGKRRFRARAYDAGSEVNTESCDHVPGGPCDAHFVGEAENGVVQLHSGIQGGADLSAAQHGWREPAVRGNIQLSN